MSQETVWLLSEKGILDFNGEPIDDAPFQPASVIAGDVGHDRLSVIANDHEVWTYASGAWNQQVSTDITLNCVCWTVDDRLLVGTERARLARGVKIASREVPRAETATGVADGLDLAVGGRIVVLDDGVAAFADDLAVPDDDTAEGLVPAAQHALACDLHGPPHEIFIGHGDLHCPCRVRLRL